MKMTETLRIALLDIAKYAEIRGGYPHNWKVASRKKLVEMGLVEEINRNPDQPRYRPTTAGQYVVDRNKNCPFGEGHYFLTREDKKVFEFRINTLRRATHVVKLQSVDGDIITDNFSDPFCILGYYTIKEAEESIKRAVRDLGWCVG